MDYHGDLLKEIERFLAKHELSETAFGQKAVNDGHFVRRLRERQNVTTDRLTRAWEFMRAEDTKLVSVSDGTPQEAA
jgi:hypothetical protein